MILKNNLCFQNPYKLLRKKKNKKLSNNPAQTFMFGGEKTLLLS